MKVNEGISDKEILDKALDLTVQFIQNQRLGDIYTEVTLKEYWLTEATKYLLGRYFDEG